MANLNGSYEGLGLLPTTAIPFIIKSQNSPNVINIAGAPAYPGPGNSIILFGGSSGKYNWNEIWQLTPAGQLLCAYDNQVALGLNSGNEFLTCLVAGNPSDMRQQWSFEGTRGSYLIRNKETQMVLTGAPGTGAYTSNYPPISLSELSPSDQPQSYMLWQLFPPGPISTLTGKVYIQSELNNGSVGSENPLVLASYNNGAVIQGWVPNNSCQIWLFNPDGTISTDSDYGLVLTATSSSDKSDNQVTLTAPSGNNQTWSLSNNELSVNVSGIGTLYMNVNDSNTSENSSVITWEQTGNSNEKWYAFQAMTVDIGTCFYIQTQMTGPDGNPTPYVVTVPGSTTASGISLVIEPLVPGSLHQLWFMEDLGVISSAMNRNMVLTANASTDNPVTLQEVQSNQGLQQWYLQSNGMMAVGLPNSGLAYLNVSGGSPATQGQGVITYSYSTQSNSLWSFPAYTPQPSGLWFTIRTCLQNTQSPNTIYLTAGTMGEVMVGPPSGGYVLAEGQAGIDQLWRITPSGNVVSALNPNLGLSAGGPNGVSLQPIEGISTNQQWLWGDPVPMTLSGHSQTWPSAPLQNIGKGQVLWQTGNGYPFNTVTLQDASSNEDTSNQLWYVLPFAPAFDQYTTIRNTAGSGLFLTLPAKSGDQGYTASLANRSGDPSLSLWMFTYPGYITSALNPHIVLSLEVDTSTSTGGTPAYTNNVCAYPLQPGLAPFQLWSATPDGLLLNQYNGMALTAIANTAPTGVNTTPISANPETAMQLWDCCPGVHLQTLMTMPTQPFVTWDAGQAIVYSYINTALGLSVADIRAQYSNLSAPLMSYQVLINAMPQATLSGATSTDWTSVIAQLNQELMAAIAVQTLFQQLTDFHLNLSQAQEISLSEAVTAAALPNQMNTKVQPKKKNKSWVGDLVEGLAYTALNVAGNFVAEPELGTELSKGGDFIKNGLPFMANLMSTGFATGSAYMQGNSQSTKNSAILANIYNYELTVWQMQQTLVTVFEGANIALGQLEALILGDWGKLWRVYQMIQNPQGIASLFWPSFMAPSLAPQMLSGYTSGILQTLLPANPDNKINATMHTNMGSPQGPLGLNNNQVSFIENNPDGTQNVYTTTCSQQAMQMVWASGASPIDFFHGLNGWSLPVSYQNVASSEKSTAPIAAGLIVRFVNNTAQAMTLTVNAENILGVERSFNYSPVSITLSLPAYGVQEFAGCSYYIFDVTSSGPGGYLQMGTNGSYTINAGSVETVTGNIGIDLNYGIPPYSLSASGQSGYNAMVNLDQTYVSQGMYLFEVVISWG